MKSRMPVQAIFREYFEAIAAAVGLALFLRLFVVSVLYLPEANMEPGLQKGDFVMSWKLAYGLRLPFQDGKRLNAKSPERGDVVSFRFPGDEEQILIRRIVGLPGEKVSVKDGVISIGEAPIEQQMSGDSFAEERLSGGKVYKILSDPDFQLEAVTVPPGKYFVLADNRHSKDDSRSWGFVSENQIESRLGIVWLSMETKDGNFQPRWSRVFESVR